MGPAGGGEGEDVRQDGRERRRVDRVQRVARLLPPGNHCPGGGPVSSTLDLRQQPPSNESLLTSNKSPTKVFRHQTVGGGNTNKHYHQYINLNSCLICNFIFVELFMNKVYFC